MTQFLEGPAPPPPPFNKEVGGAASYVKYESSNSITLFAISYNFPCHIVLQLYLKTIHSQTSSLNSDSTSKRVGIFNVYLKIGQVKNEAYTYNV